MTEVLDRLEEEVLGCLLADPKGLGKHFMEALEPRQFSGWRSTVAEHMVGMLVREDPIDPMTVMERMRSKGDGPRVEVTKLLDLMEASRYVLSPHTQINILAERYLARELGVFSAQIDNMAKNSSVASTVEFIQQRADHLTKAATTAGAKVEATTMTQFMAMEFPNQSWAIPRLLPAGTSLMVTATEGMGKSVFLRQIAVASSMGIDPFDPWDRSKDYEPRRTLIVDGEYTPGQIQNQLRQVGVQAAKHGRFGQEQMDRIAVHPCQGRFDLTDPTDQGFLRGLVHHHRPDILVIGPLYLVTSRGYTDEDETRKFQRPLEHIMSEGVSVVLEHHMGNEGPDGRRAMRPIGSSALRRWASQGIGLRKELCEAHKEADCNRCGRTGSVEKWRGSRDETWWPKRIKTPNDGSYWWLRDTVAEGLTE